MFKAKKITKTYDMGHEKVDAIKELTFEIQEGEFVAIVGPSGSGKSTLLMMLGGMLTPTSGEIIIDDKSLYEMRADDRALIRRNTMGFVFQSFHLLPYLTALQNVQLPLLLAGKEQKGRAEELLAQVGLEDRMDHTPQELSVGQQQRVALARTLANNPKYILADEPTGNLDPSRGKEIIENFKELNRQGHTVIMVTHNMEQAKQADRTIQLLSGSIDA